MTDFADAGSPTRRRETSEPGQPIGGQPIEPGQSAGRVPALDGVRAIGITLVLLFHGGFTWAGGGFVGVDVFFVLSGFLITGLLLAEFRQSTRIALKRFWAHRARRLLPALLVMLVGVGLYGAFLAPPDTLGQLRGDAIATLLYGNNWHQISGGQSYFAALGTPRPLVHTWSLSIEEQFYLAWPLIVLVVLKRTKSLRLLLTLTVAGAVASAVEMAVIYHGGAGASRAYYGTDTRAQALLVGAALAMVLARSPHRHARQSQPRGDSTFLSRPIALGPAAQWFLVALAGMGLAVVGWVTATTRVSGGTTGQGTWLYDGGFALVAVSTAAVLACVVLVPRSPWARVLSLPPVRYVGTISYGLYLWHWPLFIVLDHARTGLLGWPLFGLRVGVTFAVAVSSYHLLERPIRRGALAGWQARLATPVAVVGTAVFLFVSTADAAPALGAESASSTFVPAIVNHAQNPGTSANTPVVAAGTGGPIRVLLVGDSEASFLGFGLGAEAAKYDVNFADDGVLGCGLLQGTTVLRNTLDLGTVGTRGGQIEVPCATQYVRWTADLNTFHPDVVMLADGEYEVRNRLINGRWTHIGNPAFDRKEFAAMQAAIRVLRSTGAVVVLLTAPYYHQPEQANGQPWPEDNPQRVNRYNVMLRRAAAQYQQGVVVENLNKHLDPGGHYTQYINGIDVRYADGIHVNLAGGKVVAPWLLTQVHALGIASRAHEASTAG